VRQITDSVLIANECLDSRLRDGMPGLICKLDVEKAYDHVSWNFLLYMMERLGFGNKWRKWIYYCISTVRLSVLINGNPCGFFTSSRGLRQGDSLSPLLFVLVMEAFSRLMDRAVVRRYLEGFSVAHNNGSELKVSHLLFADDTLIFCGAERDQLVHLKGVLMCFEAVSGLRINLGKSELAPIGQVSDMQGLAGVLGGRIISLPMKYLGLPLGARYKSKDIWNPILEKMEKCLAWWKRGYLSKGGRLTLIKSTLSSLPTYFLSLFPIPSSVAKRMEKIQRNFLWGGMGDEFKYHLVNWQSICLPIPEGGLGIRHLVPFNKALLGKWHWRFAKEKNAFWREVIVSKYGSGRGDWSSKEARGGHGVSLWKHIQSSWSQFAEHVSFSIGLGDSVSFWLDQWCEEGVLKGLFPDIFRIAQDKRAKVSNYLSWHNDDMVWSVNLVRSLQDWEVEVFLGFMEFLYNQKVKKEEMDSMNWKHTKSGLFEVRSFYGLLRGRNDIQFPWKSVWKPKIPSKVAFFLWLAAHDKNLTIDNLRRRRIYVVEWCFMCKRDCETGAHLFLHCAYAWELWSLVFCIFGIQWTMPSTVSNLLACWKRRGLTKDQNTIWNAIPGCLMWLIWRERNQRAFFFIERHSVDLKMIIIRTLMDWMTAGSSQVYPSILSFIDDCL
jgi:hypothetical protein